MQIRVHDSLGDIGKIAWDRLCPPMAQPFLSYAYLSALEDSHCVSPLTGWQPCHLGLWDNDQLLGALPLYLKSHSYGEYVFDQAWAEAFEEAGGQYYPKLLSAIPFTPVTTPKLLVAKDAPSEGVKSALSQGAKALCHQLNVSSLHVNFPTSDDLCQFKSDDFLTRLDHQFWWENQGYDSFDAFLHDLSSNRRKTIRRERRLAQDQVTIKILNGSDIKPEHWDAFFTFYLDTSSRKWGSPYLNRDFFAQIGETLADQIVLVMAFQDQSPVAGALNFLSSDTLFGRQWGSVIEAPFLHFELCYYQAIEFAISNGLKRVEAGAQGAHKLARGYLPASVHSAHYFRHKGLKTAVEAYLKRETHARDHEAKSLVIEESPFKQA